MLSLPKCNSSELIPGFSVLKRLSPVDMPICGHKQLQRQNIEFWVQTWCKPCCALFAPASGLCRAVPHHADEENKLQAERSMTCWESLFCRCRQKSGSVLWLLSRWEPDITHEIETLRYPQTRDLSWYGTAVWVPRIIRFWSGEESVNKCLL